MLRQKLHEHAAKETTQVILYKFDEGKPLSINLAAYLDTSYERIIANLIYDLASYIAFCKH